MKTNYNDIDELLVKYLTGEASEAEQHTVREWLKQDEKNRQHYDHFRLIWEESLQLAATTEVDENAAWQRFQQRTQNTARVRRKSLNWVRIAATVILVAGLSWAAWYITGSSNAEVQLTTLQATNDAKSDTLPDGSFITINKNSSLTWPQQFTGNMRRVQLSGEGFFKVKSNKQKPFIVDAGDQVTVEVLGTAFNVKNRGDSIEIIVEEGRVMVKYQDKSVELKQGEVLVVRKGAHQAEKRPVEDPLHNYYRTNAFICNNTPLWKLVNSLNEIYNAKIVIDNPELRTRPVSGKFEVDSLQRVLEPVAIALDFTIIKSDSAILLR